jgi:uncharacterized protein YbjT (DUF2867 family)
VRDATCSILVTGATGNVGMATLSELANSTAAKPRGSLQIRAAVRNPDSWLPPSDRVDSVRFDFLDRSSWEAACAGIDTVFLVRPPAISDIDATLGPFIDHLADKGIKKLVFLSLQGVESMPYVPHHKVEVRVRNVGIPYIFLRPSFFMQNLSTIHRKEIALMHFILRSVRNGVPISFALVQTGIYLAAALGKAEHTTDTFERLMGRKARDFGSFASDMRESWTR